MANDNRDAGGRAMQIVAVRVGRQQLDLIQREAEVEGVSASQFIRDAAYARAVLYAARRKQAIPRLWVAIAELAEQVGSDELMRAVRTALPPDQEA